MVKSNRSLDLLTSVKMAKLPATSSFDAEPAAQILFDAHRERRVIERLPAEVSPRTVREAYAVQAAFRRRLNATSAGRCIGYKIGLTNDAGLKAFGMSEPVMGPLYEGTTFSTPKRFTAGTFPHRRIVELEFAVLMAADVPKAPGGASYTAATIAPFVAAVAPVIEVVSGEFADFKDAGGLRGIGLIADNTVHGAWILGARCDDWRSLDLAAHRVEIRANGASVASGLGSSVLGHPLNALAWLATFLGRRGTPLRKGEWVSTGACGGTYTAAPGDDVVGDFGSLGTVRVAFDRAAASKL